MKRSSQAKSSTPTFGLPQTPGDYLDILLIRRRWILVPFIIAVGLSFVAVRFVRKLYRSSTVIMVDSEKIPRNFIPQISTEDARDRLRTVDQQVRARARIERILDEHNPYPEFTAATRSNLVEIIRNRTTVSVRGSDAFVIEYIDTVPKRAQEMATRLAALFIQETYGDRERQVQGASDFIERQLEETRQKLEKVEGSLRAVKTRYRGMLPGQMTANLETLQRLQEDKKSVSEAIRAAKNRRSVLERQNAIELEMAESQLVPEAAAGPTTTSNREREIDQLKAEMAALRERYTDEHPEVIGLRKKIATLEEAGTFEKSSEQDEEADHAQTEAPPPALSSSQAEARLLYADREIDELQWREAEIQKQTQEYQRRVEQVPQVEEELLAYERDYQMVKNYYNELLRRKLEADTAEDVEQRWKEEQFRILDPAQIPETHFYPNPLLFVAVGSLVGLGAGIGLAFLAEFLDHSLKNVDEVEELLSYPLLVTIPHLNVKADRSRGRQRKSNAA